TPGIKHQRSLLYADEPRQGCGQSEAGVEAEAVEVGAKPRLLAGDAKSGHQCETQTSPNGSAVDRGDDGLACAEEADCFLVEVSAGAAAAALRCRSGLHAFRKIGPGAERAALGREHDRPAIRVGVEALEGLADLGNQVAVEEIVWRPAHLDRRDVAVLADMGVAHLRISSEL